MWSGFYNAKMNQLAREKSPYLLQHKDNPIHWYAWGEDAFKKARETNRPIFLSIGYSTCHWCHVMAHESFEDEEVAKALNDSFVCIKVDREERPDVDDVYMKALQSLTGGGGWPMSIWLTPEGKPFFAGTYFPKFRLLQLLRRIEQIWKEDKGPLLADGDRLLETIRQAREDGDEEDGQAAEWEEMLGTFISHFQHHFDEQFGGFGKAPKFPQTMNMMVMMRQDYKSGLNQAEAMVTTTLTNMLRGGVYDQLRGGFHRYSVDERWLVPHFEKMLYDQALLTVGLLEAAKLYKQVDLERGARETLDYVLREMTSPEGGFYSGQDADSFNPEKKKAEEGYFATYSESELEEVMSSAELDLLARAYGVKPQGHFEGRSILHLQEGIEADVKDEPLMKSALAKLEKLRSSRQAPHLDDKIIAAWNGWMIWAFAKGGLVLGEEKYTLAASAALKFIHENLWRDGKLFRFYRDGGAVGSGTAEDYTSIIHACIELNQIDGDARWAKWALSLQKILDTEFWDTEEGGYFINDGQDPLLPLRPKDEYDGVTPSANSMAAYNLERLFLLTGDIQYRHRADRVLAFLFPKFKRYPSGLAFLALAADIQFSDPKVAVVNGGGWAKEFFESRARGFEPYLLWSKPESGWPVSLGKSGAEPVIYVCEEGQCLAPAKDAKKAALELNR